MAEIRCPKCGRKNPDMLDVCQFCQTPLKSDSVLHIGQSPTKKNTGELESVLPEWLRDVRQQARDSAQEDADQQAAQPKAEPHEPPDLLAGLASQASDAADDEIPDWLARMNPTASPKPSAPAAGPTPRASQPAESDFFAQFNRPGAQPASQPPEPTPEPPPAEQFSSAGEEDDLSKWFARAAEQPEEVVEAHPEDQSETPWMSNLESAAPAQQEPAPKEEEDLSWLHNLEDAAKQTGQLESPKQDLDWMANLEPTSAAPGPSQPHEDLSWLDHLGSIEQPPQQEQAFSQPAKTGDDLSWLDSLGADSEPHFDAPAEKPASEPAFTSGEDLSWLNNLGGTPEPSQPSAPESTPFAQDDLSWLNSLGGTPEPSQPSAPESTPSVQGDLSWLNTLGGETAQPFTPPFSEPEPAGQVPPFGSKEELEPPDWLKSAMEAPSMPPPGDVSMDWFSAGKDQPVQEQPAAAPEPAPAAQTAPPFSDLFSTPSEPSAGSNADVDSLFSMEMPDWLSRAEPSAGESVPQESALPAAASEDSLAPVDLPSWVQAMRPVEAVISETATSTENEPEEKEGPLAGLRGVIPGMAIGSSLRPKPISLKLQASDEQQAGAALLEKVLESETSPRPLITSSFVWSQQWLRWTLTGLFMIVLAMVLGLRSQMLQPFPNPPVEGNQASSVAVSIPAGAKVLVVIDYEPSLVGEMEAVGGPLLEHMVLSSHPSFAFISTSPNGVALAERLMSPAKVNRPSSQGGFDYQTNTPYCNLGYLAGGTTGILAFIETPANFNPSACEGASAGSLSEYAALVVMTDHAESGRAWVEQLQIAKERDAALASQPLLIIASAQAGPLLQPYVSSGQINGMISGLADAARYESKNALPPIARPYWDAFGLGLMMAVTLIVVGSLWSLVTGIRARRAEAEQG